MVVTDLIVKMKEKEFTLQKAVLQLASPVLNRLIGDEAKEFPQVIELEGKAEEFEEFLRFIYPPHHRTFRLTADNVDFLLDWFSQYEMSTFITECEDLLMTLPVTEERLLQASKYGLSRQKHRCIDHIAQNCEEFDFTKLTSCPEILPSLLLRTRELLIEEKKLRLDARKRVLNLL